MERPTDRQIREKLASRGVGSLTDAELLSILIRDGAAGRSAIDTASRLLTQHGESLSSVAKSDLGHLRMAEGMGMTRAASLAAAFELSARIASQSPCAPTQISTSEDAVALMRPLMSRLRHEEMWAIYMSGANGVIEKQRVSQGGVSSLVVDTRLIVKRAVELLASSMILVHNHPSEIAEPSAEDIAITGRLAEAAALFDIMVIDHIIIAGNASYSFRQHGLVK